MTYYFCWDFKMHIQCTLYYSMRPVEWRCAWQGSDTGRLRDSVNMTKSSTSRLHSYYTHYHYKELTSLMVAKFDSYQMLHLDFRWGPICIFYANMHTRQTTFSVASHLAVFKHLTNKLLCKVKLKYQEHVFFSIPLHLTQKRVLCEWPIMLLPIGTASETMQ